MERLIRQVTLGPENRHGHKPVRVIGTPSDGISPDAHEKPHPGNRVCRPTQKAYVMRMVLLLLA